jgi:hypothetical protein
MVLQEAEAARRVMDARPGGFRTSVSGDVATARDTKDDVLRALGRAGDGGARDGGFPRKCT